MENTSINELRYAKYEEVDSSIGAGTGSIDIKTDNFIKFAKQLKAQYQHVFTSEKNSTSEMLPVVKNLEVLQNDNEISQSPNIQDMQRAVEILSMQQ